MHNLRLSFFLCVIMWFSLPCHGQFTNEGWFHMSPYAFEYSVNPEGPYLWDYLNRERNRKNKVKTCTVVEVYLGKRPKNSKSRHITDVYHYDTTGYPVQWDYYFSANRPDKRDQRPYRQTARYVRAQDSLAWLAQHKFMTPPESFKNMRWKGPATSSEIHDPQYIYGKREFVRAYVDSSSQLLVKEYKNSQGTEARLIAKENSMGEIVEVQSYFSTGRLYLHKKRMKTPYGYASVVLGEIDSGTYIDGIKFDSLGYRIWEGNEYIPKDSTRKQMRIARKHENYYRYVYDDQYYMQSKLHIISGKIVEREDYIYDENRNLTKVFSDYYQSDPVVIELRYTYYP